ncbi:uncharacterized protein LOC117065397 isoform X2 [Trachypithecus francoisi]|uniref:uncharacterized protein LOC117065397 isoform X2 n=1 Tax=Trachypithecus francoisi TaxID=54180 RepID=UPI00141B79FA|nr:uncharacterized protein LOC117065397 isoform X2 [Trachypithecus francoisi]
MQAGGLPEEKGPVETPVEKFIYESDEEAPQQWQARPPAVVTVKAGGLPEEKGPVETPVEKFIYESDEEAPQQWQARPPAVVTVKAGGLPEEKGSMKEPLEDSNKGSAEDAPPYLKIPTRPLPAPGEKAETNPQQGEEIKPSEEDEDAEEPELTCCGLCISWWKSLKICQPPEGPDPGGFPWPVSPLDRSSIGEYSSSFVFFGIL